LKKKVGSYPQKYFFAGLIQNCIFLHFTIKSVEFYLWGSFGCCRGHVSLPVKSVGICKCVATPEAETGTLKTSFFYLEIENDAWIWPY